MNTRSFWMVEWSICGFMTNVRENKGFLSDSSDAAALFGDEEVLLDVVAADAALPLVDVGVT